MKVELINIPTEITDESIKAYLAEVSSVVRQKAPRDNDKLFERLLKESYGDKPSRVFEFVPCNVYWVNDGFEQDQYFGFWKKEGKWIKYYTTARELLNWGWTWEEVLEVVDFTHYRAVRITAPYFVYGQVSTHTQITSVSHSARYTESDLGYWMPEEHLKWYLNIDCMFTKEDAQIHWENFVSSVSPMGLKAHMKDTLGIKHREVYARGADMLQYRTASLGGYLNNPNAWPHFLEQRGLDPHTQLETRQLTHLIDIELKK